MVENYNIKVALMDSDFYALQAIYSYLAWDRRTRVVSMARTPQALDTWLRETPPAELPDVTLFEVDWAPNRSALFATLENLTEAAGMVLCISSHVSDERLLAAVEAGTNGYLIKGDVRLGIAGAIVYAIDKAFVISQSAVKIANDINLHTRANVSIMPARRAYPELTDRIEQALRLCVIEGMSAELAADEMGVSPHTIRSYVKEGYRILEAHDDTDYPLDMSPQEKAFMRYTALKREAE
jgi:DNA-binding NarL/FixJ family response regulator